MGRVLGWLFLVLLIAAGAWAYFFLNAAGVFLDLKPVSAGVCRQVASGGVAGVDMALTEGLAVAAAWTDARDLTPRASKT